MPPRNVGRVQNKSSKPLNAGEVALLALIWQTDGDGLRIADMQELMAPFPAPACQERLVDLKLVENPVSEENGDRRQDLLALTDRGDKVLANEVERALEEAKAELTRLSKSKPKDGTLDHTIREHNMPGLQKLVEIL